MATTKISLGNLPRCTQKRNDVVGALKRGGCSHCVQVDAQGWCRPPSESFLNLRKGSSAQAELDSPACTWRMWLVADTFKPHMLGCICDAAKEVKREPAWLLRILPPVPWPQGPRVSAPLRTAGGVLWCHGACQATLPRCHCANQGALAPDPPGAN